MSYSEYIFFLTKVKSWMIIYVLMKDYIQEFLFIFFPICMFFFVVVCLFLNHGFQNLTDFDIIWYPKFNGDKIIFSQNRISKSLKSHL